MSDYSPVVVSFEKSAVQRLVDHAENAPEHLPHYDEPAEGPALWLIGDKGIYLMSNGAPALLANGELETSAGKASQRRFVCYAEGCAPDDDPNYWWPIHNAICDGDDFVILADRLADLRSVIDRTDDYVVIVTDGEGCQAFTETEFAQTYRMAD